MQEAGLIVFYLLVTDCIGVLVVDAAVTVHIVVVVVVVVVAAAAAKKPYY